MSEAERNLVEAGYDAVYASMLKSPTLERLWREHAAGLDFPPAFSHISFVTLTQLERMAGELRLSPSGTFVDLGCGLAGPALWMARHTGAKLIGVDLSTVAIEQATARAATLSLADRARFVSGTFAATGLPDACADDIMSEDALQYAPDKRLALVEMARMLRPGGRLVVTVFELDSERVAGLPMIGADPVDDYRPLLDAAGFDVDVYEEVPGWPQPMTSAYEAVLAARSELVVEMGEAAVGALSGEMLVTLDRKPYRRRVLITATRR